MCIIVYFELNIIWLVVGIVIGVSVLSYLN